MIMYQIQNLSVVLLLLEQINKLLIIKKKFNENESGIEEQEFKIHNILKSSWTEDDKEIVNRYFQKIKNQSTDDINDTINYVINTYDIKMSNIILLTDSAGGNIALLTLQKLKKIFGYSLFVNPENTTGAKYVIGPECWQIFDTASKKIPTFIISNNGNYPDLFLKTMLSVWSIFWSLFFLFCLSI